MLKHILNKANKLNLSFMLKRPIRTFSNNGKGEEAMDDLELDFGEDLFEEEKPREPATKRTFIDNSYLKQHNFIRREREDDDNSNFSSENHNNRYEELTLKELMDNLRQGDFWYKEENIKPFINRILRTLRKSKKVDITKFRSSKDIQAKINIILADVTKNKNVAEFILLDEILGFLKDNYGRVNFVKTRDIQKYYMAFEKLIRNEYVSTKILCQIMQRINLKESKTYNTTAKVIIGRLHDEEELKTFREIDFINLLNAVTKKSFHLVSKKLLQVILKHQQILFSYDLSYRVSILGSLLRLPNSSKSVEMFAIKLSYNVMDEYEQSEEEDKQRQLFKLLLVVDFNANYKLANFVTEKCFTFANKNFNSLDSYYLSRIIEFLSSKYFNVMKFPYFIEFKKNVESNPKELSRFFRRISLAHIKAPNVAKKTYTWIRDLFSPSFLSYLKSNYDKNNYFDLNYLFYLTKEDFEDYLSYVKDKSYLKYKVVLACEIIAMHYNMEIDFNSESQFSDIAENKKPKVLAKVINECPFTVSPANQDILFERINQFGFDKRTFMRLNYFFNTKFEEILSFTYRIINLDQLSHSEDIVLSDEASKYYLREVIQKIIEENNFANNIHLDLLLYKNVSFNVWAQNNFEEFSKICLEVISELEGTPYYESNFKNIVFIMNPLILECMDNLVILENNSKKFIEFILEFSAETQISNSTLIIRKANERLLRVDLKSHKYFIDLISENREKAKEYFYVEYAFIYPEVFEELGLLEELDESYESLYNSSDPKKIDALKIWSKSQEEIIEKYGKNMFANLNLNNTHKYMQVLFERHRRNESDALLNLLVETMSTNPNIVNRQRCDWNNIFQIFIDEGNRYLEMPVVVDYLDNLMNEIINSYKNSITLKRFIAFKLKIGRFDTVLDIPNLNNFKLKILVEKLVHEHIVNDKVIEILESNSVVFEHITQKYTKMLLSYLLNFGKEDSDLFRKVLATVENEDGLNLDFENKKSEQFLFAYLKATQPSLYEKLPETTKEQLQAFSRNHRKNDFLKEVFDVLNIESQIGQLEDIPLPFIIVNNIILISKKSKIFLLEKIINDFFSDKGSPDFIEDGFGQLMKIDTLEMFLKRKTIITEDLSEEQKEKIDAIIMQRGNYRESNSIEEEEESSEIDEMIQKETSDSTSSDSESDNANDKEGKEVSDSSSSDSDNENDKEEKKDN